MTPLRTPALIAALLATLACGTAAAQYRWVDADGKVHYGDAPPREAKDVRSLSVRAAPTPAGGEVQLPFELRRAVERSPVVLYTGPDCQQPCAIAASMLRERGVPFTERTVSSPDDLQEFRRVSGGLRLPHISVGGQAQSGFSPELWQALLDAAGYPKGSMLPRSYQWPSPQPLVPPAPAADAKQAAAPATDRPAAPPPAKR